MDVEFPVNGRQAKGYLAPAAGGSGPGLIVLQEWWGLVDHIKDVCNRFAEAGFTAMAPDLFHGDSASAPDKAERLMMALNIEETAKDLNSAVEYLSARPEVSSKSLGVIGFCMGGQLALLTAAQNQRISAVADFYGIHPNVNPDFSKMKAKVLGVFAEKDGIVTQEAVSQLKSKLEAASISHEFKTFEGVDHAFFNDTRPEVFNPEAAQEAWKMATDLFRNQVH